MISVTPNQIERLYSRFTSLDRGDCGTLSREDFLRIPELAINPLGDRIVHAFFAGSHDDRVNFLQFMQVLAHFRPIKKHKENKLNNREEKLKCKSTKCLLSFPAFPNIARIGILAIFRQLPLTSQYWECYWPWSNSTQNSNKNFAECIDQINGIQLWFKMCLILYSHWRQKI